MTLSIARKVLMQTWQGLDTSDVQVSGATWIRSSPSTPTFAGASVRKVRIVFDQDIPSTIDTAGVSVTKTSTTSTVTTDNTFFSSVIQDPTNTKALIATFIPSKVLTPGSYTVTWKTGNTLTNSIDTTDTVTFTAQ